MGIFSKFFSLPEKVSNETVYNQQDTLELVKKRRQKFLDEISDNGNLRTNKKVIFTPFSEDGNDESEEFLDFFKDD